MAFLSKQIYSPVIVIVWVILLNLNLGFAHTSGSCGSEVHEDHGPSHAHHHCDHGIGHHRHDHHQHDRKMVWKKKLPEELAEEEYLKLLGFGSHHHDHEHQDCSDLGLTGFAQFYRRDGFGKCFSPLWICWWKIGDFCILVRNGFSVSTDLFFNFLSALVVLVGTALVTRIHSSVLSTLQLLGCWQK